MMKTLGQGHPIMVGVDGSEQALHAVEWAAREAAWRKAPLRIISVSAMPSRMRPYGDPGRARLGSIQHPLLSHAHGAIAVVPSLI